MKSAEPLDFQAIRRFLRAYFKLIRDGSYTRVDMAQVILAHRRGTGHESSLIRCTPHQPDAADYQILAAARLFFCQQDFHQGFQFVPAVVFQLQDAPDLGAGDGHLGAQLLGDLLLYPLDIR